MKQYEKIIAFCLALVMLFTAFPVVDAVTSDELRDEIDQLEKEAGEIDEKLAGITAELEASWASIEEMVAYKNRVDEQIFLLYSQMENLNSQISAYTILIAQTQAELDTAEAELETMNQRYRARIRAMEEEGKVSYWEVLFKANSFMDLIDRLNMIREIAEADQRMMAQLKEATEAVARTKESLEAEKVGLEASRADLLNTQASLNAKRDESSAILQQMNAEYRDLEAAHAAADAEKQALIDEIARTEMELTEVLRKEEEERRRKEEEERKRREEEERKKREEEEKKRQEEEEKKKQEAEQNGTTYEPTEPAPTEPPAKEPENNYHSPSDDKGWVKPCSYIIISSVYGYRKSGWHNGVDFANNRGTPIYASRSGTVTTAKSLTYSYGNYVTINHYDGYSSLYAHLDYYIVDVGDYVVQGQLIGYMGSTGNSTGNHLHFTVFYNGSTVNPMELF